MMIECWKLRGHCRYKQGISRLRRRLIQQARGDVLEVPAGLMTQRCEAPDPPRTRQTPKHLK
eukprot:2062008-Amphidinium_carterae.1